MNVSLKGKNAYQAAFSLNWTGYAKVLAVIEVTIAIRLS